MAFVVCPSCGEKGRLPKHLIGHRIKCQKCGSSFLVEAPVKAATTAAPAEPNAPVVGHEPARARVFEKIPDRNQITVDGLDDSEWKTTVVVPVEAAPEPEAHDEAESTSPRTTSRPPSRADITRS